VVGLVHHHDPKLLRQEARHPAEAVAACHARFSDLAASQLLRDVVGLYDALAEAQQSNPRGAANRKRDDAERAALQHRFDAACARVENLGESLVAAGAEERDGGDGTSRKEAVED
jgi:hypothetical protein